MNNIKFIFEDGDNTPSSRLLKSSFNGDNIYFSNEIPNMIAKLNSLYKEEDTIILFVDVVPNNSSTVEWYNHIRDNIADSSYTNVYVVPILCIEYYLITHLHKRGYLLVDSNNLSLVEDLINIQNGNCSLYKYKSISLEKLCRRVIKNHMMRCMRNVSSTKHPHYGLFYTKDCICDRRYCRLDCKDTLKYKAECFYTELPVFDVISDEHIEYLKQYNLSYRNIDFDVLRIKLVTFFDMIFDSMHTERLWISFD